MLLGTAAPNCGLPQSRKMFAELNQVPLFLLCPSPMLKPRQLLSVCATPASNLPRPVCSWCPIGDYPESIARRTPHPVLGLGRLHHVSDYFIRLRERATKGFCRQKIDPSRSRCASIVLPSKLLAAVGKAIGAREQVEQTTTCQPTALDETPALSLCRTAWRSPNHKVAFKKNTDY